ncbi:MAG: hypothetical protein DHS20C15_07230 [Planctomycetota bacterium]|nr:MAG: hypothetical protein DHS20C15_07230 [Planctomycetota bacterium]
MAKRSGSRGKAAAPRKPRSAAKDSSFEVEEAGAEAAAEGGAHGLETGLVFFTFICLLLGFVLIQMRMAEHGAGLFG